MPQTYNQKYEYEIWGFHCSENTDFDLKSLLDYIPVDGCNIIDLIFVFSGIELSFFSGVYSPSIGFTNRWALM
jgi:hypothetical protein